MRKLTQQHITQAASDNAKTAQQHITQAVSGNGKTNPATRY